MIVRDPFIFTDTVNKCYYLHAGKMPVVKVFKSVDLKNWEDLGNSFVSSEDFWAPDIYLYNQKYYLFITFNSETGKRGTSILVSSNPEHSFAPLVNQPITPQDWMCLDV
jgi:beta-xylosidase